MKYYRFKTHTTSYYFPELKKNQSYMYGLYSAYGSKIVKLYWWVFKNCFLVRTLHTVNEKNFTFPYELIKTVEGENSLMAFNMGSPGTEQKISILGYDYSTQSPFFAKFSQKKRAMELSKNEIRILTALKDTGIATTLFDYKITDSYVFLKTECVQGTRPQSRNINEKVVEIAIQLSKIHLTDLKEKENIRYSFSHGDFCPWNFLICDGNLRLIDWEMAADRPLGYDIFTYLFQTSFLFEEKALTDILKTNESYINAYFQAFDTIDYYPYLKEFVNFKLKEISPDSSLYPKYQTLYNFCN